MNVASRATERQPVLARMLRPQGVALAGVSGRAGSPMARPLQYLREYGFSGEIYPVNPNDTELNGLKCYPSLVGVPGRVDLLLVLVPTEHAPDVIDQAGEVGAAVVAIVFASGFAETGAVGAELQAKLAETGPAAGVRILGPNCQGLLYTLTGLYATFTAAALSGRQRGRVCWPERRGGRIDPRSGNRDGHWAHGMGEHRQASRSRRDRGCRRAPGRRRRAQDHAPRRSLGGGPTGSRLPHRVHAGRRCRFRPDLTEIRGRLIDDVDELMAAAAWHQVHRVKGVAVIGWQSSTPIRSSLPPMAGELSPSTFWCAKQAPARAQPNDRARHCGTAAGVIYRNRREIT